MKPVLAFDPTQRTNAERVKDLARLGYLPSPVLDPTYGGFGGMWKEHWPDILVANDGNPDAPCKHHYDYESLPPGWTDHFGSALFDPPYRLGGTPSDPAFDERYGLQKYRTIKEVQHSMFLGLGEMFRVVRKGGYVIVKVQDHVSSGPVQWQTTWVQDFCSVLGVKYLRQDELYLIGGRSQPKGRTQKHARRNYSTFMVLKVC